MRSWGHTIPVCVANPPWRAVFVCDGEGLGGVHRKQGRGGCWAARLQREMACMRVRLRIAWTALLNTMCKARHQTPPAFMSAALPPCPAYLPRTGRTCRYRCGSGGVWDRSGGSTCQCGSGLSKGGAQEGERGLLGRRSRGGAPHMQSWPATHSGRCRPCQGWALACAAAARCRVSSSPTKPWREVGLPSPG